VSLTIRKAKLSDAPALAALMRELGYETSNAEMRQRLKSILTNPRFRTFVAEIDNTVCGMIGTLAHASHEHNDLSGKIYRAGGFRETAAHTYRARPDRYG